MVLVRKKAFGSITCTVAHLNCQERSKRSVSVRKLLHVVQQTEIPLIFFFLKRILFSRVGAGDVFAAGVGAFHEVLISLKTQNLPVAEFQQFYRHVLI